MFVGYLVMDFLERASGTVPEDVRRQIYRYRSDRGKSTLGLDSGTDSYGRNMQAEWCWTFFFRFGWQKTIEIPENHCLTLNDVLVSGLEHGFYDFPCIGNVIIPIDFHIFQGVKTTNQCWINCFFWTSIEFPQNHCWCWNSESVPSNPQWLHQKV